MLHDAGLVALPPDDWGKPVPPLRRNLSMRILRTPHNVVSERQPQFVSDWGTYRISPNATLFSGAGEDALATLNRAGARGAAVLGAGAGFLFSSSRLTGAFTGAILGYFGGAYLARLLGTALEMQKSFTAQVAAK